MPRTLRVLLLLVAVLAAVLPTGLGGTAYAAGCTAVGADQVRADSAKITGSLPPGTDSVCYTLDLAPGTVLAAAIDGSASVRAGGSGAEGSCLLSGIDPGPCRLSGSGPYRLTVAVPSPEPGSVRVSTIDYHLSLLALTGDNGCQALVPGAPGTSDGLVSDTLGEDDLACRTLDRPAGPLALSSVEGDGVTWELYDGVTRACVSPDAVTSCDAPAGTTTLLFSGGSHPLSSSAVRGQVVDLSTTSGCGSLTPSWSASPPNAPTRRDGRLDCRLVSDLQPGDPVALATNRSLDLMVDAHGDDACRVVDVGCVATGTAPFRLLTASPDIINTSYQVLLRKVGPTSDCPVITPLAFGSVPDDNRPGVGCRQFTAQRGHHYIIRGVAYDRVADLSVYGPGYGRVYCSYGDCDPVGGNVTIINRVDYPATFVTSLYDKSSDAGCLDPGLGLTGHSITLRPGVVSCDRIDVPSGSSVISAARLDYGVVVDQSYVDDSGASALVGPQLVGPAAISGPTALRGGDGPYRSLTWTQYTQPTTLSVATAVPDDLGDCKTVATGGSQGTATTFKDGDPVAKCRRIPATSDPAGQAVHVGHDSGNRFATSILFGDDDEQCPGAPDWVLPCGPEGSSGGTVVVAGTPTSSDTVARADVSRAPVRWRAPVISGTVRAGQTVTVGTGDADWYNPGGHFRFRWLVGGKVVASATGASYRIPSSASGKSLVVEVTAFHGRVSKVARSTAATVASRG